MARPRGRSRPDDPASEAVPPLGRTGAEGGVSTPVPETGTADVRTLQHRGDPGRLIERTYSAEASLCQADEVILAWLMSLPPDPPPPKAAARLRVQLTAKMGAPITPHQQRLVELLDFVARHRRRASRIRHANDNAIPQ